MNLELYKFLLVFLTNPRAYIEGDLGIFPSLKVFIERVYIKREGELRMPLYFVTFLHFTSYFFISPYFLHIPSYLFLFPSYFFMIPSYFFLFHSLITSDYNWEGGGAILANPRFTPVRDIGHKTCQKIRRKYEEI